MATPVKPTAPVTPHATPKLGRGIRTTDSNYGSAAIHQSGSKVVQRDLENFNDQFIKRKTELAELLRSTSKKRPKISQPIIDGPSLGKWEGPGDFPDVSGLASHSEPGDGRGVATAGSLLNDSVSFSIHATSAVDASFNEAVAFFDGNSEQLAPSEQSTVKVVMRKTEERTTVTEQTEVTVASTSAAAMVEVEESSDSEDEESPQRNWEVGREEEEEDGRVLEEEVVVTSVGARREGELLSPVAMTIDTPHPSARPGAVNSAVSIGPGADVSDPAAAADCEEKGDENGASSVAKALLFSPTEDRGAWSGSAEHPVHPHDSSSSNGHNNAHRKPFEQPPLVSLPGAPGAEEGLGPRTPLLQNRGPVRFTSPSSAMVQGERGAGYAGAVRAHIMSGERAGASAGASGSAGGGGGGGWIVADSAVSSADRPDLSFEGGSPGTLEDASPTSYSYIYRENLLHQLKVVTSKNAMLEGKLRDIEQLVDRNYGTISERSKLLTAERNKLERQRATLEDELVATREELVFIRAQLQTKSARISELETELMDAQRRLLGPSQEESELEEEGVQEVQEVRPEDGRVGAGAVEGARPRSPSSSPPLQATLSQEEAADMYSRGLEMDLMAQKDAREIELLKGLLVEQEQQLIEGEARAADLQRQLAEVAAESAVLAEALEAAEAQRAELAERVNVLEGGLKEAQDMAFEHEARAAALEVELFRSMDEEHRRAVDEARAAASATVTSPSPAVSPATSPRHSVVSTVQFPSSSDGPRLPLRKAPLAPLRVSQEGRAGLLITVAVLLVVIWVLILLVALLYLGMLEQRFGVDILADGGVYDQLFMFRGIRALGRTVVEMVGSVDAAETARWLTAQGSEWAERSLVVAQQAAAAAEDWLQRLQT